MRISNFTTIRPEMARTRTAEDFMKFLNANPARLGLVASLYDQYTASHLTESLMNVFARDDKRTDSFMPVNNFLVEWAINVNQVKRVEFVSVPVGDGKNGSDITVHLKEAYYQKYDTFIIEESRQQLIVLSRPIRRHDNDWEYTCQLQDSDYNAMLDLSACQPGMTTRFITNYMPELHSEGYTKHQSNIETHRTWISTHRADASYSARYKAMEDSFIQIGKGEKDDPYYKLNPVEKDCLDTFMLARNNSLVWGKTNVDEFGKSKVYDPETGEPIISGDGIIAQVERFADKFVVSKLTVQMFHKMLNAMVAKSEKPTGNQYIFIVNTPLWNEVQTVLGGWIRDHKTNGTFLYSKAANGMVDVGATYQSYEYGGKWYCHLQ